MHRIAQDGFALYDPMVASPEQGGEERETADTAPQYLSKEVGRSRQSHQSVEADGTYTYYPTHRRCTDAHL